MRCSEITPELTELSKKAKALGFPQDIEEGDWGNIEDSNGKFFVTLLTEDYMNCPELENNDFLILSFSRCLEWLQEDWFLWSAQEHNTDRETFGVMVTRAVESGVFVWSDDCPEHCIYTKAKAHHEAIAKAVVKILEGKG